MDLTGSTVPKLGLGTWQNTGTQCSDVVRTALETGYRHIDTAELYENERAVGVGIADAAIDRDDVFLATKVLHPRNVDGELTRTAIRAAIRGCLGRLGVASIDLMYVHWPGDYDLELVHTTLAEARDEGLLGAVGVSNYGPEHVDTAVDIDPEIVANQIELHPLLPLPDLRSHFQDVGLDVVAYAPLAHGKVFDVPELQSIAEKHDVSVARVTLAWLLEHDVAAVPKATSSAHITDNWESRTLDLDETDVNRIDRIDRRERLFDPDYGPDW